MAIIHFSQREIEARVVYWGPALSGKTTSLRALHDFTPRGRRGVLETLDTQDERTLYFDYLPLMWGTIAGFRGRVKILGVPGQALYRATRRLLLQGADGVVFVADSQPDMLSANVESLNELQVALRSLGRGLDELPLVFQYNKRDLADALPVKVLEAALNARGSKAIETVAINGDGIAESFHAILEAVSTRVEQEIAGGSDRDLVRGAISAPLPDREEVRQTLHAIAQLRPDEERGSIPAHEPLEEEPSEPFSTEEVASEPPSTEEAPPEPPPSEEPPEITEPTPALPPRDPDPAPAEPEPDGPAYAVVTLPYLPRQLEDYEVNAVHEPIIESDGTVMVRISVRHPVSGRHRRVRVRLVTDEPHEPVRTPLPELEAEGSHTLPTIFTLLIGFGLGVGVVWLFLS